MIKTFTKYLISGVFIFSAFTKLFDYQNTIIFFDDFFGIGLFFSKIVLSVLVFIEIIISYLILFDYLRSKSIYVFIISLMTVFITTNILFAVSGKSNCGCFGTAIISSPFVSIIKNIIILLLIFFLRHDLLNKAKLIIEKEYN